MDENIAYRRAEVGDIEQIKEILFDLKHHQNLKRQYPYIENMDFLICWKSKKHLVMILHLKK